METLDIDNIICLPGQPIGCEYIRRIANYTYFCITGRSHSEYEK